MKSRLNAFPSKPTQVADRHCKRCGKRIPRGGLNPSKYARKAYCSTLCSNAFKQASQEG